ncbi:phosphate/phosphite/phosphonate ABC transporter substrate-binding protein [Neptuniibacter sp. CAU 1671]|uniref:phosphate/phosphite/phosphonate ABC transporter substrate-binding protein n=1 Tax=Neptuniibacter sp. CAU 1671 TaxID=3032593 RepID=UPI0023DBAA2C|nr:phosphate/phosphite/phosphonate ABC transporter substrate-binding protein [Neptuniibacter sp. CAU 1671]MDF2181481.1 phosphate/phosphite/phosphonate ABC transporter substrate-binding protein [Neptuniibacter sp. CAU 1671]
MTFNLTVSPDFAPSHISGWYYFNTWLQRQLDVGIHLELYDDFAQQREDLKNGSIDLIYANPYDASMLVRELGFKAVARPARRPDETVIVTLRSSDIHSVEDLKPGITVATTDDPDVHTMGMIMLEPADLDRSNINTRTVGGYVVVAKALLNGSADIGFFLKDAYEELSELVRKDLKVLVSSQISVIHHALLVGPKMQSHIPQLKEKLLTMGNNEKGAIVLENMGLSGWDPMSEEQTEFMIDLIDTLIPD